MNTFRKIVHFDLDAFFCAVEEIRDPKLCGKPFAVGGRPEERGVVASCSYAARSYGVHSAMPMAKAIQLCPELICVSSHHYMYQEMSKNVIKILRGFTNKMEQLSIDEVFLDLEDSVDSMGDLARSIQTAVRKETGLPSSIGVASNKLLAKIANDYGKSKSNRNFPPNAITIVPFGKEAQFLAPLPVDMLYGVGKKTAEKMHKSGIITIGDLARIPELELQRLYGSVGRDFYLRSRGIDDRPVVIEHERKSYSCENTFAKDVVLFDELAAALEKLSKKVAVYLQRDGRYCNTVKIKLRWSNFDTITRQRKTPKPINEERIINNIAYELLAVEWENRIVNGVRLLGVGVSDFEEKPAQLELWGNNTKKQNQVLDLIRSIRDRFGESSIMQGFDSKEED